MPTEIQNFVIQCSAIYPDWTGNLLGLLLPLTVQLVLAFAAKHLIRLRKNSKFRLHLKFIGTIHVNIVAKRS